MTTTAPTQRRRYLQPASALQQPPQQLRPSSQQRRGGGRNNNYQHRYPGSYDYERAQKRECIFFCLMVTVLALVLCQLIFILVYISSSGSGSSSSLGSLLSLVFGGGGATIAFQDDRPILIVGGSDGSGTRAFVDTLRQLGAVIVSDDPKTFDVHASEIFHKQGWPAFVKTVLEQTHSANYHWDDLPSYTQDAIKREIKKFQSSLAQKYSREKNILKRALQSKRRNALLMSKPEPPVSEGAVASKISYAIKAPVSMLVLPVFQELLDRPIKFLHVVRDGRDIALSDNQSPVLKFYNTMYENNSTYATETQTKVFGPNNLQAVRAMHLWNDWNVQVQDYLTGNNNNNNNKMEYLTMRSEDLLSKETRWQALQALADFIGSPLTEKQLCCMVYEATRDFGQSAVHSQSNMNAGNKEYNDKELQAMMARLDSRSELMDKMYHKKTNNNRLGGDNESRRRRRLTATTTNNNADARFVQDFSEYKRIVHSRGKAMQKEQLQEWIDNGRKLQRRWEDYISKQQNTLQKTASNNNDNTNKTQVVVVDYSTELEGLIDLLESFRLRKDLNQFKGLGMSALNKQQPGHQKVAPKMNIANVHQRYGKWQKFLAMRPELSDFLHQQGKVGLERFGYEPPRTFTYATARAIRNTTTSSGEEAEEEPFVCTEDISCA